MDETSISQSAVTLTARDGFPLAATRFDAQGECCGRIVVAGATAVPQGFYRRFAEHAAKRGYAVLTLDYRGIGRSRPGSLRGFDATFIDWGTLDLPAAIDLMAGDSPLFLVGHSFGGHAVGMLPNRDRIAGCYFFGVGAGWAGWMPPSEAFKVRLMWHVIMPSLVAWKGYMPASMLGIGEDLPAGVYRQWKRWCGFPHYFFDDPKMKDLAARYGEVRMPIAALNSLDDLWAPPRSRDAFLAGYRNAPIERIDIDPRNGIGAIGHMGYFRPHAQALWDDVLAWFDGIRSGRHRHDSSERKFA